MMLDISDLRKKPRINFTPGIFEWMSKLTNEELSLWEAETIEEARKAIQKDGREIREDEIRARVRNEAQLLDRDYRLLNFS